MKILGVANNYPQRVVSVLRTFFELVTHIEKMPPLPQEVQMEETRCEKLWRMKVISEA